MCLGIIGSADANTALAGASPYLEMMGIVTGGWMLARSALAATAVADGDGGGFDAGFLAQKVVTARFWATQVLPRAAGLAPAVTAGPHDLLASVFTGTDARVSIG
ncbi:MAG: acyl-CoA dehydrogenase C-terminal domain-containing protein [Ilumatobacteraceae bacterium]